MMTIMPIALFAQNKKHQTVFKLTIIDSVTESKLSGATVSIGATKGYISDINGIAAIDASAISYNDTIKISYVGYKPYLFNYHGIFPDTILLDPLTTDLQEVSIHNTNKKISLGCAYDNFDGGYLPGANQEIAEYIPNNAGIRGTILSIDIVLDNVTKGVGKPFKINIYSKNKGHLYPGKKLIQDSIIVYDPERLTTINVDISKYNIQVPPEGIFIGFETLSPSFYNNEQIKSHGQYFSKIPGIKGHFANHGFDQVESMKDGLAYSLLRDLNGFSDWSIFAEGTNFALGATVSPD
jgi:hypothetical protein